MNITYTYVLDQAALSSLAPQGASDLNLSSGLIILSQTRRIVRLDEAINPDRSKPSGAFTMRSS